MKISFIFTVIGLLFWCVGVKASTNYPGGIWEPGPARYGFEIVDDVPIKMDDGVVLRASISYPTDLETKKRSSEKFPVVIEHTPYVQFQVPVRPITYLTEHGYISIVVRARGAGKSEGEIDNSGERDGKDSANLIRWAANTVEGSDGRVGMVGCSWPGMIALSGASQVGKNSPLKAIISACSGFESIHREAWLLGGLPTNAFWAVTTIASGAVGNTPASQRYFDMIKTQVKNGEGVAYSREYWNNHVSATLANSIIDNDIPVLLWSGWSDFVTSSVVRSYTALQNAYLKKNVYSPMKPNQETSSKYQMIMGDWAHTQGLDAGIYLQWLETWVRGIDTGIQKTNTPMHIFEKGTNRWINASTYPLVTKSTKYFLQATGLLSSKKLEKTSHEKISWGEPEKNGAKLSYVSEVFADGITIAGPMSATIYASSSNKNLVLIGKLYDVDPSGKEVLLTSGAILGSLSQLDIDKSWIEKDGTVVWPYPKFDKDRYLNKNKIYRFDLALSPRQWGVLPNHRIKFELTTKASISICPDQGLPSMSELIPCGFTQPQQNSVPEGIYNIVYGGKNPSSINLPILPFKEYKEVRSSIAPTPWIDGLRKVGQPNSEEKNFLLPLDWGNTTSEKRMQIFNYKEQNKVDGASENFTGAAKISRYLLNGMPTNLGSGYVEFSKNARTNWHTHPLGQLLFVTSGAGYIQEWGKPIKRIKKGDVVWTPPGVKHWHGAGSKTPMAHIAVTESLNGKAVDWNESVSEEQYKSAH